MGEEKSHKIAPGSTIRLLGLQPDGIGTVSIEELAGNVAAVRMLVRQYFELEEATDQLRKTVERQEGELGKRGENALLRNSVAALEQQLRVYEEYEKAYSNKKWTSRLGSFLQLVSSVAVGVGVNLSTPALTTAGGALLGAILFR